MFKTKTTFILRILLVAEIVILLANAIAIRRDYQDSWVLEGLTAPFAIFVLTYIAYVFVEKRIGWILMFAVIFEAVFALVPNLKYPWFQGIAVDQHQHFGLISSIYNTGHISTERIFETVNGYSGTPLMHLLVVAFSKVSGLSLVDTYKYVPFFLWYAFPLFVYVLVRRLTSFMKDNTHVIKYAVVVASIPSSSWVSYTVVGSTFGMILVFLFLSQFVNSVETHSDRSVGRTIVALIFGFALVMAHTYSSMTMLLGLLVTYAILALWKRRFAFRLSNFSLGLISFLAVTNFAWLSLHAQGFWDAGISELAGFIRAVGGISSGGAITGVYPRFFQLGIVDEIRILLLFYGETLFLLLFVLIGILIILKRIRTSRSMVFLSVYVISLGVFLFAQVFLTQAGGGLMEYGRLLFYMLIPAPVFVGLAVYYLSKKVRRFGTVVAVAIVASLMLLAVMQVYNPPQLVPPASAVGANLPSNEPIVYMGNVNSAYQRSLIAAVEKYIQNGTIAIDDITRNQLRSSMDSGFFYLHVLYYYPLSRIVNKNMTQVSFDYFLTHLPGKAGGFMEQAETRTESLISESVSNSSVIYTNGESFICTKPFLNYP